MFLSELNVSSYENSLTHCEDKMDFFFVALWFLNKSKGWFGTDVCYPINCCVIKVSMHVRPLKGSAHSCLKM